MSLCRKPSTFGVALIFVMILAYGALASERSDPKIGFQTPHPWRADLHLPTDSVMVYGDDPAAIQSWRDRGYEVWTMFGASWLGKNEEVVRKNPEIVQTLPGFVPFEMIKGRAWVVPVKPWIDWTKSRIDRLIAAGSRAILPEEPEYWASTGYSPAFRQAWKAAYKERWRDPNSSLDARWRANRLKAGLFRNYYKEIFAHAKSLDPGVKCLIPIHSNLNYADWGIVSPHHAYVQLPGMDGFIGQVWTGTAKHPHALGGEKIADPFSYAYLEYSSFDGLVRGTGQEAWFLADPVEDEPGAPWERLRGWYEDTVTAALMFPHVNHYEVAPWPSRFLQDHGLYGGGPIPREYATELLAVWAAQGNMPAEGEFDGAPSAVGLLTADSLMWQRGGGRDRFQGFVAPALSLVRRGVPVSVLPAERMVEKGFPPAEVRLLIASFDAWKPERAEIVEAIAEWVRGGGTLFFLGGEDGYNAIESGWWRKAGYDAPSDALLDRMGLDWKGREILPPVKDDAGENLTNDKRGLTTAAEAPQAAARAIETASISGFPLVSYKPGGAEPWLESVGSPVVWTARVGEGRLVYAGFPGEFVAERPDGERMFLSVLRLTAERAGVPLPEPGGFILRRGPYVVARAQSKPLKIEGTFFNLFRPEEPVRRNVELDAGENAFLLDLEKARGKCEDPSAPCLLFAGSSVMKTEILGGTFRAALSGPESRKAAVLVLAPGESAAPEDQESPPETSGAEKVQTFSFNTGAGPAWGIHAVVPVRPEGTEFSVRFGE